MGRVGKAESAKGGVMLEVLLGLGIMIIMTPIILRQIRKYNEQIAAEEVVAQMGMIQKAVSAYISFDKSAIPAGCVEREGQPMKAVLATYGGRNLALRNGFGQSYYFVTCRKLSGDIVAMVGARGGNLDDEGLNGLGQYMFDQGAVVNKDNLLVSNYDFSLDPELERVAKQNKLSLIMFVSDANITSDFLHADRINGPQGSLVNTMLVDLNMSGNPIKAAAGIYGGGLIVSDSMSADAITGVRAEITKDFEIKGAMSFHGETRDVKDSLTHGDFPFDTYYLYANEVSTYNASFVQISMPNADLAAKSLESSLLSVRGDLTIDEGADTEVSIGDIAANTGMSSGPRSNDVGEFVLNDADGGGIVYSGDYEDGLFSLDASSTISLSGVSSVIDICWVSSSGSESCVSDMVDAIYQTLMTVAAAYQDAAYEIGCKNAGGC
ncbi:MAG: hypothetical protein LBT92_02740 [Rickettsiales bacterium]|jgi:hypothetical protein|nr:hypothetical protein [Rickettsiales bacterium]